MPRKNKTSPRRTEKFLPSYVGCLDVFRVVIIFDWDVNMRAHGFHNYDTRKMRINGKHKGALEAMCIIDNERP